MNLRQLTSFKDPADRNRYLQEINSIRSAYPWSTSPYTSDSLSNVFLLFVAKSVVGFVTCSYSNINLIIGNEIYIDLTDLHILASQQKKGYGHTVISHLLSKGLRVQAVVVLENLAMFKLLAKFDCEEMYRTTRIATVNILGHKKDEQK